LAIKSKPSSDSQSKKNEKIVSIKSKKQPPIRFKNGRPLDKEEEEFNQQILKELEDFDELDHLTPMQKAIKKMGRK